MKNFILRVFGMFERAIFRIYEPSVIRKIGGFDLKMPYSHNLLFYLNTSPYYDRVLPRICNLLQKERGKLKIIDVGANVGDTVALIFQKANADFLCIDGADKYFKYLLENAKQFDGHVFCEKVFLGKNADLNRLKEVFVNGTARLVENNSNFSGGVKTVSLDYLLQSKYPDFKKCDLLKIDTDGYEYNVVAGALNFLKSSKPLVFFEFTPSAMKNPISLLDVFYGLGYTEGLFYANTGEAKFVIKLNNRDKLNSVLSLIDNKNIYYYDVLVVHKRDAAIKKLIFEKEMDFFKK